MSLFPKANLFTPSPSEQAVLDGFIGPSLGKSRVSNKPRRNPRQPSGRMSGYVKLYDLSRNFGFVRVGRDEYFFHRSALGPGLEYMVTGEMVQFDLGTDRQGRPVAKNITLI
ncbi:cold shock domain-containing protein [Paenibacillus graminis]|uniref:cold shock domain-containing protein n=1 Tax=Paenibacillus graminis TaxID=189425 RepID=UPI002DB8B2C1|nr:cold shock domain-containing protein [Paenibacillus graminis]MEC0167480.1 cold shock domain-containing protein [Paenibacillus graminis]